VPSDIAVLNYSTLNSVFAGVVASPMFEYLSLDAGTATASSVRRRIAGLDRLHGDRRSQSIEAIQAGGISDS
jgi:hypothetical protein